MHLPNFLIFGIIKDLRNNIIQCAKFKNRSPDKIMILHVLRSYSHGTEQARGFVHFSESLF